MWILESQLDVERRNVEERPFDSFRDLLRIGPNVELSGMSSTQVTTPSARFSESSRTKNLEHGPSCSIAGEQYLRDSDAGQVAGKLDADDGDIRHSAPTSASGPSRSPWRWQFDLAGNFRFAERFSRRNGESCFRTFGAGVEIAAVLKGRESAKRPNTRRSQGRSGETSARCTSTGKQPRSAIHGSETDTLVTDGLVQAGPFDQVPGPGPLLRRMKPRHQGLLDGCGGQPSGSREPSGESCSPNHHEPRA